MFKLLSLVQFLLLTSTVFGNVFPDNKPQSIMSTLNTNSLNTETITLAGGCFWCIEAVLLDLKGVEKVVSGYTGGKVKNPGYKEVCSGLTGHAEAVQVTFNPEVIKLEDILEVFWTAHDPTTLNRQGADVGTQYRSAIFYNTDAQKEIAERSIKEVATKIWDDPIVTEVSHITEFYPAEAYHQNYYNQNKNQPYCQVVINPKVKKVREKFAARLKN